MHWHTATCKVIFNVSTATFLNSTDVGFTANSEWMLADFNAKAPPFLPNKVIFTERIQWNHPSGQKWRKKTQNIIKLPFQKAVRFSSVQYRYKRECQAHYRNVFPLPTVITWWAGYAADRSSSANYISRLTSKQGDPLKLSGKRLQHCKKKKEAMDDI